MNDDGFDERGARADAIDLRRLLPALARRKWWIVVPTFASFVVALLVVTIMSPRFTGVAKVLLVNQESYFTRPDKASAEPTENFDPEGVQSQAETVATTELARQAASRLSLAERAEFNPAKASGPLTLLLSLFGGRGGAGAAQDRVVDAFLSRLTVFPVARSRVLQIEFVSEDPALAARGANTVAALYLAGQEEAKKAVAKAASAWLSQKIDELRGKVAAADAKVEAFRAESGLFVGANGLTAPSQQLADINAQVAAARAKEADAAAAATALRALMREGRLAEIPDAAKDESLRRYVEQRVALKAQIALESRTLLPGHPRMKELNGELAGLESEIRAAAGKAVLAFENDAKLAAAQVATLSDAAARQSAKVAGGNVADVELRALELDAKTARDQLESYLAKNREAMARDADNAAPADARIIESASEPRTPTFPKKGPTILLATLAGFLVSAGLVVARALLADDLGAPTEAASTRAPSAAETEPVATAAAPAEAPEDAPTGDAAVGESAAAGEADDLFLSTEALAARLAALAHEDGAITALFAGEGTGRTLWLALESARRLAGQGRAALVDLGASQDWLPDVLDRGVESEAALAGLAELLDGRASFAAALHRDLSSRLDIVPAGAGEIAADGLAEALVALAESYDFVVLHASDWRSPEAAAALAAVDVFVVVAPAARLGGALRRVNEILAPTPIAALGLSSGDRRAIERAA